MSLINAILAFKAHLLKRAIDAELLSNGITADLFWEKLRELEKFRVAIGGEVVTVSFDPSHMVMIAIGSGLIDCIPNRMLLIGDAPTPAEKDDTDPLAIESEAVQLEAPNEPASQTHAEPAGEIDVNGAQAALSLEAPQAEEVANALEV